MKSAQDCTLYVPSVSAEEYLYDLPQERIAVYPLPERDNSKLLVAHIAQQTIEHKQFPNVVDYLPSDALLVMNNTRVITARVPMRKATGGAVEVLCLAPVAPSTEPALALQAQASCQWRCLIGGKRVRAGTELEASLGGATAIVLRACVLEREGTEGIVEFSWAPASLSFAAIIESVGVLPLPPYLQREAETSDTERYQTVYAKLLGSVAAPTAGLHFTPAVLQQLQNKGVTTEQLTLHVGAGTFQPLQSDAVEQHPMHREYISVPRQVVERLHQHCEKRARFSPNLYPLVPVGTTSVRTLESLYWFGVQCVLQKDAARRDRMELGQWDAYQLAHAAPSVPPVVALEALLRWMDEHKCENITGGTRIMIVPGYSFAFCDALITNFHQPHSTLILLVAAFTGKSLWRTLYTAALENKYRFLSYGDSSLLLNYTPPA